MQMLESLGVQVHPLPDAEADTQLRGGQSAADLALQGSLVSASFAKDFMHMGAQ